MMLTKQVLGAGGGTGGGGVTCSPIAWLQKPLGAAKTGSLAGFGRSSEHQQLNQPPGDTQGAKLCLAGLGCPRVKGFCPSFAGANANWMPWQLSPAAGR